MKYLGLHFDNNLKFNQHKVEISLFFNANNSIDSFKLKVIQKCPEIINYSKFSISLMKISNV